MTNYYCRFAITANRQFVYILLILFLLILILLHFIFEDHIFNKPQSLISPYL